VQQGFEVFLPVYLHAYPRLGERLLPLFPGYLFVRFDPDNDRWGPLMHSRGVKRLFTNISITSMNSTKRDYGQIRPVPVSDGLIHTLQQQIIEPPDRPRVPVIAPGARVRVTGGHFQDQVGICAWSSAKRVALLLQVMSGQVECSFDRTSVELAD